VGLIFLSVKWARNNLELIGLWAYCIKIKCEVPWGWRNSEETGGGSEALRRPATDRKRNSWAWLFV
jgi:hypothetical protein